jgi:hypothetical protein
MGADEMVNTGTNRDEALRAVIDLMLLTQGEHVRVCSSGYVIEEEP